MARGFSILLILIFLIFGIPPLISGYYFKQNYLAFLNKTNNHPATNQHFKISILKYREGWFSSDATLKLSSTHATFNDLIVNEHITHGPFIFDTRHMNAQIALGKIHDEIALATIFPILTNQPPIMLTSDSILHLNNEITSEINMPQTTINLSNAVQIFSAGLHGAIDTKDNNDGTISIYSNITLGNSTITLQYGPFVKINIMPITHVGINKIYPNGFSEINSKTNIPTLAIVTPKNYTINNINFTFMTSANDPDSFNQNINLDIDSIDLPNANLNEISGIKLHITTESFSISGVRKLQAYFSQPHPPLAPDQSFAIISGILTPKSIVNFEMGLATSAGIAHAQAKISWPDQQPLPQTIEDFKNHVVVDGAAKASIALFNQFITYYFSNIAPNFMPQPLLNDPDFQQKMQKFVVNSINQNINDGVTDGFVTKDNDSYSTNVSIESGITKINGVIYTPAPVMPSPMLNNLSTSPVSTH